VAVVARELAVGTAPDEVWQVLSAVQHWPHWSPFARRVEQVAGDDEVLPGWQVFGSLGRMPVAGVFRTHAAESGARLLVAAATIDAPFRRLVHEIAVSPHDGGALVRWRVEYDMRGPGGWIVDRWLVRRQVGEQVREALERMAAAAGAAAPRVV
jgi:ribosome-associated toxin RatA of RatAB toxin-antitoxin module